MQYVGLGSRRYETGMLLLSSNNGTFCDALAKTVSEIADVELSASYFFYRSFLPSVFRNMFLQIILKCVCFVSVLFAFKGTYIQFPISTLLSVSDCMKK